MTVPQILVRFVPTWEPEIEIPKPPERVLGKWIKWNGGELPVLGDTTVEVELRGFAETLEDSAAFFSWRHLNSAHDIVAYRTIE